MWWLKCQKRNCRLLNHATLLFSYATETCFGMVLMFYDDNESLQEVQPGY